MKAKEILKETITFDAANELYNLINAGKSLYLEILKENENLFNTSFENGIKRRLKTIITYKQFDKKDLYDNFSFEISITKVNTFGYKIPELRKKNILINVFNTKGPQLLPNVSKYKKDRALYNNYYYVQRQLNLDNFFENCDKEKLFIDVPLYVLLTYDYCCEREFTQLIVPSSEFNSIEYSLDLQKIAVNKTKYKNKEIDKNKRFHLKKEILKELNRRLENG